MRENEINPRHYVGQPIRKKNTVEYHTHTHMCRHYVRNKIKREVRTGKNNSYYSSCSMDDETQKPELLRALRPFPALPERLLSLTTPRAAQPAPRKRLESAEASGAGSCSGMPRAHRPPRPPARLTLKGLLRSGSAKGLLSKSDMSGATISGWRRWWQRLSPCGAPHSPAREMPPALTPAAAVARARPLRTYQPPSAGLPKWPPRKWRRRAGRRC